jgi:hypothetical protein
MYSFVESWVEILAEACDVIGKQEYVSAIKISRPGSSAIHWLFPASTCFPRYDIDTKQTWQKGLHPTRHSDAQHSSSPPDLLY